MTPPTIPKNAYTDAPEQHPNLILGSLQLLFWLVFRPTAWRNHIARIDSFLRPDFCLAELSKSQWQDPALRRLLIQGCLILPLSIVLLIDLSLWLTRHFVETIDLKVAVSVASTVMTFGVALSLAISFAVGIVGGIAYGMATIAGYVTGSIFLVASNALPFFMAVIVPSCMAFGIAGSLASNLAIQKQTHSLSRQAGGVLVGILLGIMPVVLVSMLTINQQQSMAFNMMGVVAIGLASFIRTRQWRGIWVSGLTYFLVSSLLFSITSTLTDIGMDSLVHHSIVSALFVLPYSVAERIAGFWAGATAGAILASIIWFI